MLTLALSTAKFWHFSTKYMDTILLFITVCASIYIAIYFCSMMLGSVLLGVTKIIEGIKIPQFFLFLFSIVWMVVYFIKN